MNEVLNVGSLLLTLNTRVIYAIYTERLFGHKTIKNYYRDYVNIMSKIPKYSKYYTSNYNAKLCYIIVILMV